MYTSSVHGHGQASLRSNSSICFASIDGLAFGFAGRNTGLYAPADISSPLADVGVGCPAPACASTGRAASTIAEPTPAIIPDD